MLLRAFICLVLVAQASNVAAAPARFWISPSATNPFWPGIEQANTLEVDLIIDPQDIANSKTTFYIWAQPATDKQLHNITLDIVSNAPILDLAPVIDPQAEFPEEEVWINNPSHTYFNQTTMETETVHRFSHVNDGFTPGHDNPGFVPTKTPSEIQAGAEDKILGLQGLNLTIASPMDGIGIGGTTTCLPNDETCADTSQGLAWRIGSFGVQSVGELGNVSLHLQIGKKGMSHVGEMTADTDVIFSATDLSPTYNAGPNGQRQFTASNDDAEVLIHLSNQLTGDYSDDNFVGGNDFLAWQRASGNSNPPLPNRRLGLTGPIGQQDLLAWETNYGKSISPPTTVVSVPEPTTTAFLFVSLMLYSFFATLFSRPRKRILQIALPVVSLTTLMLALSSPACATIWWTGDSSGSENGWQNRGNWSIASNANTNPQAGSTQGSWQGGDLVNGNDLVFNHPSFNNNSNSWITQLDSNTSGPGITWTPRGIEFASANTITIQRGDSGSELEPGNGGINITNGGDAVIDAVVRIRSGTGQHQWHTGENSSASLTLLRNLDLNGHTLTITGSGLTTINGNIQDKDGAPTAGSLIKRGPGTLVLNGTGNYTGTTKLRNGILKISQASNISSELLEFDASAAQDGAQFNFTTSFTLPNTVTLGSGLNKFRVSSSHTGTLSGAIGGSGGLTKIGTGVLLLDANNTYSGATTITGGTLRLNAGTVIWNTSDVYVNTGATFDLNGNSDAIDELSGAGNVTLGSGAIGIGANGGSSDFEGIISGSGALQKVGAGTLELSGNNTYTGVTNISAGTLRLGTNNSIGNSSDVLVGSSATFDVNGFVDSISSLSGTGTVLLGNGTLTVGNNNSNTTYSGIIDGSSNGKFTKQGTNTLTLTANNAYPGLTTVSLGTLALSGTSSSTSFAMTSGNLTLNASERMPDTAQVSIGTNGSLSLANNNETIGSLSGAGNVFLGNGELTVGGNNANTTYSGVISGTGTMQKFGTGALTLSGSGTNTYTGATAITAGRLELGNHSKIWDTSDVSISSGATFDLNNFAETIGTLSGSGNVELGTGSTGRLNVGANNGNSTYTGRISGGGLLEKRGTGTLTLSGTGTNTHTGTTAISAGRLELGNHNKIWDTSNVSISSGATFDLNNFAETIDKLLGSGTVDLRSGTLTVGANNSNFTFTGTLNGSGDIMKVGSGNFNLSGTNNYTGTTIVNGGTLSVTASNLPGNPVVNTGGVLAFVAGSGTFTGDITGTGILRKETASTVSLTGNNTHTGGTEIAGGVLSADLSSLQGNIALTNNAEFWLTVTSNNSGTYTGNITGAGTLRKTVTGGGTLTLSGVNDYTGGTIVEAGKLVGDTLSLRGPITLANGTELLFNQSAAGSFTGTVQGDGVLRKTGNGNLTIGGAMSHTGGTIVESGKLIGNINSLTGNITSDTEVIISQSSPGTFSANLSGPGKLTKIKVGEITVTGPNSYSGGTDIFDGKLIAGAGMSLGTGDVWVTNGGTLAGNPTIQGNVSLDSSATLAGTPTIQGNVTGPGRVAPGNSPGILTINGDYTQSTDSVLEIEVGGLTPGPGTPNINDGHDQVRVGGTATLDGRYDFPIINEFVPSTGDSITFIDTFGAGSIAAGTRPKEAFAPGLEAADPDLAFRVVSSPSEVRLEFVDKSEIFFDDAVGADVDWFVATGWTDPFDPTDRIPEEIDVTTVGNALGAPQRVKVNSNDPTTGFEGAEIAELAVGNNSFPITVEVDAGYSLNAKVGNVTINSGGTIELDGGALKVASTQIVDVAQSGMLSGSGNVVGTVEVGMTAGSNGATLSPGMDAVGMEVGLLEINGDYTQGADGVFAIDITGNNNAGVNHDNHDFVDVTGVIALEGTLTIDASELAIGEAAPGDIYEILTAGDSLTGEFDDVLVTGRDDIYFEVTYGVAGALAALGDELAASASGGSRSAFITFRDKGDANGDGAIDDADAQAFAAAILDFTQGYNYDENTRASLITLRSAFNFTSSVDTQIDLDDIPGFLAAYSESNSVSMATASAALTAAFESRAVPEPSTVMLCMTALLSSLFKRRRTDRATGHSR